MRKSVNMAKKIDDIYYLSPSTIRSYAQCPMAYRKKKKSGADVRNDQLDLGRWIHKSIEVAVLTGKDLIAVAKELFVEYGLDILFFRKGMGMLKKMLTTRDYFRFHPIAVEKEMRVILPNGVGIKGIIDLVIERGKRTIEVIDWKSGDRPPAPGYLKGDIQMAVYNLLVRKRFPGYPNVLLTVDYLQYGPQTIESVDLENETLHDYLKEIYNAIFVKKTFPARYNPSCGRCLFGDSCPLMKDLERKKITLTYRIGRSDDKDVADEYFRLYALRGAAQNRIERAREYFDNLLGDEERMSFKWGSVTRGSRGITIRRKRG